MRSARTAPRRSLHLPQLERSLPCAAGKTQHLKGKKKKKESRFWLQKELRPKPACVLWTGAVRSFTLAPLVRALCGVTHTGLFSLCVHPLWLNSKGRPEATGLPSNPPAGSVISHPGTFFSVERHRPVCSHGGLTPPAPRRWASSALLPCRPLSILSASVRWLCWLAVPEA